MLQEKDSLLHRIGNALRAQHEGITRERVPTRWVELIHYLDEEERRRADDRRAKTERHRQSN